MQLSGNIEKWREGCLEDILSLCEAELRKCTISSDFTCNYIRQDQVGSMWNCIPSLHNCQIILIFKCIGQDQVPVVSMWNCISSLHNCQMILIFKCIDQDQVHVGSMWNCIPSLQNCQMILIFKYIGQNLVPVGSMWNCIHSVFAWCTVTYQGYQERVNRHILYSELQAATNMSVNNFFKQIQFYYTHELSSFKCRSSTKVPDDHYLWSTLTFLLPF